MLWSHLPLSKTVRKNRAGPRQTGRKDLSHPALHVRYGTQERVDLRELGPSSFRQWRTSTSVGWASTATGWIWRGPASSSCSLGMTTRPSLHNPWSCFLLRWPNLNDCAAWTWGTHECFEILWPNINLTFISPNIALSLKVKLFHYSLDSQMPALDLKPISFHKLVLACPKIAMSQGPLSKTSSFPANSTSVNSIVHATEITFVNNALPSSQFLNQIFWSLVRIDLLKFRWFFPLLILILLRTRG